MNDNQIHRRRFLWAGAAASMTAGPQFNCSTAEDSFPSGRQPETLQPTEYETFFANLSRWDFLGRPRDWTDVRECRHPFSPERVIVVPDDTSALFRWYRSINSVRERVIAHGRKRSIVRGALHFDAFRDFCKSDKGTLCILVMKLLTDYYGVPGRFLDWAKSLVQRELLASTGIISGTGLFHDFQFEGYVPVRNAPVDWWLIQIPDGHEFQSWDGGPVHLIGAAVQSTPLAPYLHLSLAVMERVLFGKASDEAAELSRLDRLSVCRLFNSWIPSIVEDLGDFTEIPDSQIAGRKGASFT